MTTILFVLWIFVPGPWSFGPFPMTAGWMGAFVFSDAADCAQAVSELQPRRARCIPTGQPYPQPVAAMLTNEAGE